MIDSQGSGASGQGSGRMNSRNRILVILCVLLCFVFFLAVYRQRQVRETEDLTLQVALYPIIPDLEKFESDIERNWEAVHPDVELQFVDWSCYYDDPPDDLDVFVFDSIFLSEFIEKGYLEPFPEDKIPNKEDLVPFAVEGCREEGTLYAVPQLLCTHFLYTRKDDAELAGVDDIVTLYEKIGDRKLQTEIPEENEGLLIDMSGGTTKVVMYLDAQIDCNNAYTEYADLSDRDIPSEEALNLLIMMRKMGGEAQVKYEPEDGGQFVRARWFSEGKGRAYIDYSEAMSAMGDYVDQVDIRAYSYSAQGGVSLFTSDLAGVNAKISDSKKELAYDLVNILTSEDVMAEAMSPGDDGGSPQYLLPARIQTYERLGSSYPVYTRLEEIVLDPGNRIFRIGSNVREYIANMKKVLPGLVFSQEEASVREDPDGSALEVVKAMIISDLHYTLYKETDSLLVPGIAVAEEITDAVTAEVIDRHPDVLIMTGDNTNSGYSEDVAALVAKLQKIKEAGIPVILTTGNHDYDLMEASEIEKAYFGLLDPVDRDPASLSYTAIVKDAVFLAMDDNAVNPGGQGEFSPETMQWIGDILAKYRGHPVIFLSHHNVLYGYGEEDSTSHLIQNPELPDLLREGGVRLAMTGHMHFPYIAQEDGLWEVLSGMPFSGEHLIGNLEIGEDGIAYYAEPIDLETYGSAVRVELERLDGESAAYMEEILSGLLEQEGIYGSQKKKVLKLTEKFLLCYSGGTLAEHAQEIREDPSYDLMIKGLWNYNYGPWMKAMIETTRYSGRELEITWQ